MRKIKSLSQTGKVDHPGDPDSRHHRESRRYGAESPAKLGSGESFAAVTKTFSRDSTFSSLEYIIGTRGKAFDEAVTSLNPGEYSKPFQDNGKYFIVRLSEKIPTADIPFETVMGIIRRELMNERGQINSV